MNHGEKRGFKRKTIKDILDGKLEDWLTTLPKELAEKCQQTIFVAGGAITSMLLGEEPNDYDVYFTNPEVAKDIAEYYLKQINPAFDCEVTINPVIDHVDRVKVMIKSAGLVGEALDVDQYRYFEGQSDQSIAKYFQNFTKKDVADYKLANMTSNAISLNGGIQLILVFCGLPKDIISFFDYTHTKNYYYYFGKNLELNPEALECILAKELKYSGSKYPLCAMFRMRKFIQRGWTITAGEMFKIGYDVSELNLNDVDVLREQLIGVDTAYFIEVLAIIGKIKDREMDRTYLFKIINRVFD